MLPSVNSVSRLVSIAWGDETVAASRPNDLAFSALAGGDDGVAAMTAVRYQGDPTVPPDQRQGLAGLEGIDPISILSVPDDVNTTLFADVADRQAIRNSVLDQCELLRDRFAVLNIDGGSADVNAIPQPRDSSYGAVYYPWIRVLDSRTSDTVASAAERSRGRHLRAHRPRARRAQGAGQRRRARHRAPRHQRARAAAGVHLGKHEQDILNPRGINVIRDFRARRARHSTCGARGRCRATRTDATSTCDASCCSSRSRSTKARSGWSSSRNDDPLWARVRQSIGNFLRLVWRSGALQGDREERGVLCQVRPNDHDPGGHRCRATDLLDRRRPGEARRVRDLPHPADDQDR